MTTITVADRAGLLNAFEAANGGDTIVLKDGHYGGIKVTADYASTVTVRAEGSLDATIANLVVSGGSNIKFDGIEFDSGSNGGMGGRIVSIQDGSKNIAVVNSEVTGKVDGVYQGHFGIYSTNSSGITIANNDVRHVDSGIVMFGTSNSQVSGNEIDYLARDAMKFSGLNNVTIADNVTRGHYYTPPGVHNDFIQFQGSSSNVLIDGNMLLVNTIPMVQGIFLDDASYNKITIQNNVIYNGITHGVTVTDGSGITVRNNTLLNTPGEGHNGSLIMVPGGSVVENNISTSYPRASGMNGSNLVVQNKDPGGAYYVDDYFVNGSAGRGVTLQDLVPVAGSLGASKGAAARLYELLGGKQPSIPTTPEAPEPTPEKPETPDTPGVGGDAGSAAAINAGGKAASGFGADGYFSGGGTWATSAGIDGTSADAIYQTERYGDFKYAVGLDNGTYDVTLKFAEIYLNGAGQRLFDVRAEGRTILDNFDVFAAGGKNAAVDRTFQVKVSDGRLDLDFDSVRDNAKVSGIEITPASGAAPSPNPSPAPAPTPKPIPAPDGGTDLAVNAGGKGSGGFGADAFFFGGDTWTTRAGIGGTSADAVYQTERYGDFRYAAAVEDGTYDVTLHFAEIYLDKAGQRLFDVKAENRIVLDNYDVFREAGGKNVAHEESFQVKVTDGRLDLDFIGVRDNAKVSGIEIDYLA